MQRTQVMQAKLAAAHPEMQTWSGVSLDHRGTSIALDVTPMGFHASVRGPNGQGAWYVDPAYNKRGTAEHLVYYGAQPSEDLEHPGRAGAARSRAGHRADSVRRTARAGRRHGDAAGVPAGAAERPDVRRLLRHRERPGREGHPDDPGQPGLQRRPGDPDGPRRRDRASSTSTPSRRRPEPNGPCGTHSCYTLDPDSPDYVEGQLSYCDVGTLQRNQTVLGQLIGASNYDIGHIALGTNGGGIAGLGVVGSVEKAPGCTGIPDPVGDYYAIDYVAHEMGHQFGGQPHLQRHPVELLGRQPQRGHVGRAGLRHLDHGVRRHLPAGQPAAAQRPVLLPALDHRDHCLHRRRRAWTRSRSRTCR